MSTEEKVHQDIRYDALRFNCDLWRNNVGASKFVDDYGTTRVVRYGLLNDTKELNSRLKSSDLVGITPILITPELVGRTFGVFTAVEAKRSDWAFSPDDKHAAAQQRFIDLVHKAGGFAGFARNVDEFRAIYR